jgi:hypothetical protein
LRGDRRGADLEHPAGVAVVAVLDHGDVDVDDIAFFQLLRAGNAMADHMIDRGADGFGKAAIVERRRNRLLHIDHVVMANPVQFFGGDALAHMGPIISSTSAANRPATRIFSISAGVL